MGISKIKIFESFFILIGLIAIGQAQITERHLDFNENYSVSWFPNMETSTVRFILTVRTLGFVGFGISEGGGMFGADIVIGGQNGNDIYFGDYHATGASAPILDDSQDWVLLSAMGNGSHRVLEFYRPFDTLDTDDVPITDQPIYFIWSFGDSDTIEYHGYVNRGAALVNILDPSVTVVTTAGPTTTTTAPTPISSVGTTSTGTTGPPITTTETPVTSDCIGKGDGIYPHPSECGWFVTCRDQVMETYLCEYPSLFDPIRLICTQPSSVECGVQCFDKADGEYPHPMDCIRYVSCLDHNAQVYSCPPPLLFDPERRICNFADLVNCA